MGREAGPPGRRVLVVEDEAMIAILVEDILRDAGYRIVGPISSVGQALEVIEAEPPDAALLDIRVHERQVFAVADALASRGVPFIFVSGYSAADVPAPYRQYPFLAKPFHAEAVLDLLERTVGARAAQ